MCSLHCVNIFWYRYVKVKIYEMITIQIFTNKELLQVKCKSLPALLMFVSYFIYKILYNNKKVNYSNICVQTDHYFFLSFFPWKGSLPYMSLFVKKERYTQKKRPLISNGYFAVVFLIYVKWTKLKQPSCGIYESPIIPCRCFAPF